MEQDGAGGDYHYRDRRDVLVGVSMAKFLDLSGVQRLVDKIMDWATPANIGAAPTSHNHSAANITSGTPENIGAADEEHTHSAADITSGTMSINRLPTITVAKGGTGATTAAQARVNLGVDISAETIQMFANAGYPIE